MADILETLAQIVGATDVLTGDDRFLRSTEWETHQPCHARAIVRPSSTQQVSEIMRDTTRHKSSTCTTNVMRWVQTVHSRR